MVEVAPYRRSGGVLEQKRPHKLNYSWGRWSEVEQREGEESQLEKFTRNLYLDEGKSYVYKTEGRPYWTWLSEMLAIVTGQL